jgi:glycosyltransferase involved in cell wall biosynthesis
MHFKRSLRLIPNCVSPQLFYPAGDEEKRIIRKKLAVSHFDFLGLCVASVKPRKQTHLLVEAWKKVVAVAPGAGLCVVGPIKYDSYFRQVEAQVKKAGIEEHVIFTGQVSHDEAASYFRAADLFVFTSGREGLPNACLEAQACALPSVVMEAAGVTDFVYRDGGAVIVAEGNTDAFAAAVLELMKQPVRSVRVANEAYASFKNRFSSQSIAEAYEAQFMEVLHERGRM